MTFGTEVRPRRIPSNLLERHPESHGSHESTSIRNTAMIFAKDEIDASHSGHRHEPLCSLPATSDPSGVESLDHNPTQTGSGLGNAPSAKDLPKDAAVVQVVRNNSDELLAPHYQHNSATDDKRAEIETLFSHPSVRIIKFNTGKLRTASSSRTSLMRRTDGSGTLPWSCSTESTVAVGPTEIYRVPGSVSFLHSGSLLHALSPRC